MSLKTRVFVVGNSDIQSVARLQRITASILSFGYHAVCIAGSASENPSTILKHNQLRTFQFRNDKVSRILNFLLRLLSVGFSFVSKSFWKKIYLKQTMMVELQEILNSLLVQKGDVIICSHWSTLPLIMKHAAQCGAVIIFDENDSSLSEHLNRGVLGTVYYRLASCALQDRTTAISAIISPCEQYRKALTDFLTSKDLFKKSDDPLGRVIRNVQPFENIQAYESTVQEPDDRSLIVSYQGLAIANRNLDLILNSAALWSAGVKLDLQPMGKLERQTLKKADELLLENRMQIVEPAPAKDIALSLAERKIDVGLCIFDASLPQLKGSLPNKFFAYLAAGAPVIATRNTDCADIIEQHGLGYVIDEMTEAHLVRCIEEIKSDLPGLKKRRQNALRFSVDNTWEKEAELLKPILSNVTEKAAI